MHLFPIIFNEIDHSSVEKDLCDSCWKQHLCHFDCDCFWIKWECPLTVLLRATFLGLPSDSQRMEKRVNTLCKGTVQQDEANKPGCICDSQQTKDVFVYSPRVRISMWMQFYKCLPLHFIRNVFVLTLACSLREHHPDGFTWDSLVSPFLLAETKYGAVPTAK